MKKYKVMILEQVTSWREAEVYVEAETLAEAQKMSIDDVHNAVVEYGYINPFYDTEEVITTELSENNEVEEED